MTAADVLDEAGYNFDDLTDDTTEVREEPVKAAGTSRGTGTTGTRRRRSSKTRLDALQRKLSTELFTVGTMAGVALPVTGIYVIQEADAFTKAVVDLASKRPEWVEALEHIADVQPGLIIGRTCLGVGAAIAVDRKRAEPDTKFMQFIGVYGAWKQYTDKLGNSGGEDGSRYKPPPVQFQPLT